MILNNNSPPLAKGTTWLNAAITKFEFTSF